MKLNKRIAAILLALLVAIALAAPVFAYYPGPGGRSPDRKIGVIGNYGNRGGRGYYGYDNYRRGTSYRGNYNKFNKCEPKKEYY